ncbi:hypothetical protein [Rubrivirga marina]|uniref:Uncharacterized protein n=1 Tax=Rubrivirga marina TaxID=1196024 RepID=A0A271J3U7_9BACT|nr:hypothetical protein [Rubrivirga marina]PAP77714.1 hypothetical protein BSZ37_15310 [Rubrivirga marina]
MQSASVSSSATVATSTYLSLATITGSAPRLCVTISTSSEFNRGWLTRGLSTIRPLPRSVPDHYSTERCA